MPLQKHILLILAFIFSSFITIAQQRSDAKPAPSADPTNDNTPTSSISSGRVEITDSIINYGKQFLNAPYRYGSGGSDTFDCSGFTSFVYRNFGFNLTHSSAAQAQQFDTVKRTQLKTGDLVYFGGSRKNKRIGHVGIVVAANGGKFDFIHASCDRGVTISSSEEPYYNRRYITANRVIGGTQLLAANPSVESEDDADLQSEITVPTTYQAKRVKKTIPAEYHKVKQGETLSEIAEKYHISVAELKRKNGIKGNKLSLKQRLKVKDEQTYSVAEPVQLAAKKATEETNNTQVAASENKGQVAAIPASHKVKRGESLFSIAKMYGITVDELKNNNNLPKGKIVSGQVLKLPQAVEVAQKTEVNEKAPTAKPETKIKTKVATHRVMSGESLFSIAKMYGVSVDELRIMNNMSDNNVHGGQVLKITIPAETTIAAVTSNSAEAKSEQKVTPKKETAVQIEPKSESAPVSATRPSKSSKIIVHKVHAGENMLTLARDFKIPVEELKRINNIEGTRLSVGQEVLICINPEAVVINQAAPRTSTPTQEPVVISTPVSAPKVAVAAPKATVNTVETVVKAEQKAKVDSKQKTITYKVKRHDNLNSIAKNFNITIDELKAANDLNGNKISVGQKLKIVQSTETATTTKEPAIKAAVVKQVTETQTSYKVRKHDNLNSIAQKFNITIEQLKAANDLSSDKISVGQKLKIVQSTETATNTKEPATKPAVAKQVTEKQTSYKVRRHDNLNSIAQKFNITIEQLKEANNLKGNKVNVGQELKIVAATEGNSTKEVAATPAQKEKQTTYKVKKGDNLNTIAKELNVSIEELKQANNLTNNKINVGQELKVDQSAEVSNTAKEKEKAAKPETATKSTDTYKVKKGENLISIAKDFNMTVDELKELNNLSDNKIHSGQKLVVSKASTEPAKSQEPKQAAKKQKTQHYTVKTGDSYYTIAHKFDCDLKDLKEWNSKIGNKLQPGDVLTIKSSNK